MQRIDYRKARIYIERQGKKRDHNVCVSSTDGGLGEGN